MNRIITGSLEGRVKKLIKIAGYSNQNGERNHVDRHCGKSPVIIKSSNIALECDICMAISSEYIDTEIPDNKIVDKANTTSEGTIKAK